MRILFIYKYEFIEPLGIMYLSAFLKKAGHRCFFIDLKFEKNFIKEIERISPDIIAYSITTGKQGFYQKLNLHLKKKFRFFSVFGGPHCTFFPEFINEEGVDAICIGEGEFAFAELADALENGKNIKKIKNLWIKKNGKIYKNEVRNLIEDLDALPFPDRELVNKYKHYRKAHRRYILTGRGCPYNCSYCFNHSYNKIYNKKGKIIRKRSVKNVIEELKIIRKNDKLRRFHFVDDTFILDKEWVIDFCKVYRREINLPFLVNVRVNLVDEDIVKALKEAGSITIVYAIESGNDYIRNSVLKRNILKEQIIEASKLFRKYKIETYVDNMIGLPDETLEMAFETIYLNIKCKPSYSLFCLFQPYPKTELCEYSFKKGYFDGDVGSFGESYYYKSIMKMKDMDKIERLRHLSSLAISFPIMVPITKILIRLPLNKLYIILWNLHRAWSYFTKVKWIDFSEIFIRE